MSRRPKKQANQNGQVAVLCTVGALYDEGDIMVVVADTVDHRPVVAWVPKEDITILEQPLSAARLRGAVRGQVVGAGGDAVQVRLGAGQESRPFWVPREAAVLAD